MIALIAIGAVVLLAVAVALSFNGLVRHRNRCQSAWSQIDVQLERRHNLIPNLVATAKGYAAHERSTLEMVTEARANAVNAGRSGSRQQQARAESALTDAVKRLFAIAEAYPQLKANQNFLALQQELTTVENQIADARRRYNDSVLAYNTHLQTFPRNLLAGPLHFSREQFFEAEPEMGAPFKTAF